MTNPQPQWHLLAREKPPVGAQCEYVIVTDHGTAEGCGRWDYQDGAAPRSGFYIGSSLVVSDPSHTIWRLTTLAQPEPEGADPDFPWDEVMRMCRIILGHNFGHKELDSIAFEIGHHPNALNPPTTTTGGHQ